MENTKNADFQKLFALEISYVNSLVAMIFMAVSIILYFADIFSKFRFERVILEARAFEKLNYSEKNYRSLKEKIDSKMCGKSIFSLSVYWQLQYIFLVLLNAVHLWNYRQEWISFEKEKGRMQESKWNFLGFATVSSSVIIILLILNDIWTTKFFIVNRSLLFGGISIICTTFVGFLLARKKVKMKKGKMNEEYRALLYFVAGAACIAVQYAA